MSTDSGRVFGRFLDSTNTVLRYASMEADRLLHPIGSEHLLLGLLRYDRGVVRAVFEILGLSYEMAQDLLAQHVGVAERNHDEASPERSFTPIAWDILEEACYVADEMGSLHVHPEHLLLAIAAHGEVNAREAGTAGRVLEWAQISCADVTMTTKANMGAHGTYINTPQ